MVILSLTFSSGLVCSPQLPELSSPSLPFQWKPLPMCLSLEITLLLCEIQGTLRDWVISFPSLSKVFLIYISVVSPNYHPFGFLFPLKLPFPVYGLLRMFC